MKKNQRAPKRRNKPPVLEQIVQLPTRQPFSAHIDELRSRLLVSVTVLILGSILGYFIHDLVLELLVKPLNQPLFYSSPAGGFEFMFNLSLFVGFVISLPVFVYEVICFISPILSHESTKKLSLFFLSSCVLLILGMLFAYFVSLPAALHFLNLFATGNVKALISTSEYFSFITRYLLGFGFLFQLPLLLFVINSIHTLSVGNLMKYQRWVILISFIIAAILTPTPDVMNQTLMALPLIFLYEFSLGLLWLVNRKKATINIDDR